MSALEKPEAKLLVVDDEQIVHESVGRILREEGYRVDGALRVSEALDLLSKESYDLVLTDLMMPDDSGLKAVEAVARDHPFCGVLMFTGYATVESAVESMKLGALDYLPKPFTPEELVAAVEKSLQQVYKSRRDKDIVDTFSQAEKAISGSLDLKEILQLICTSMVKLLKLRGSALLLYNKKARTLDLVQSRGLSKEYLDKGAIKVSDALDEFLEAGEPVLIEESEFDGRLQYPEEARQEGIAGILSIPLRVKDASLGVVRLYSGDKKSFDEGELEILKKFAEQAARALENAMSYERVRSDVEGLKKHFPGAR
jgi:DNA-binding response OmpR family regulator